MVLEYVPSHFKRGAACAPEDELRRACETVVQAPMPALPIEKGRPGPARCSPTSSSPNIAIISRCIARLTFTGAAGWRSGPPASWRAGSVRAAALLEPLAERDRAPCARRPRSMPTIRRFRCSIPAAGERKTGRLVGGGERREPLGSTRPPAAFYLYSPDRKAERAHALLKGSSRPSPCRCLQRLRQTL